ncbi:hypothetical protein EV646_110381 [Kribbella antiqua]|uniref:Uncharacterized protein n=1 Tax=Kribbella antiqua TaxID=2512217 RepID=A0A4R2IK95_9ACTN|nr:hypothetical protein [Kribbella antiqua]TCO44666.1 hypothetical protein EV646_110381 [Kribbella antiqua]
MADTPKRPALDPELETARRMMSGLAPAGSSVVGPAVAESEEAAERSRAARVEQWARTVFEMSPEEMTRQPEALGATNFHELRWALLDRVHGAQAAYDTLRANAERPATGNGERPATGGRVDTKQGGGIKRG